MDSENINELLNKYWNCETTLEEEKQLHAYFRNNSVPESLKETAVLFRYFEDQRARDLRDASFNSRVINAIRKPKRLTGTWLYNSMRMAAGIVVLVLAVWLIRMEVRKTTPVEMADTYDNPKMAFEETKKALLMISKSFGTAEEQAKKINLFNEAQQEIQQKKPEAEL